jgi:ferredoxin-NADP reductase
VIGPCSDGFYRIAVKLLPESRGGSTYLFALQEGVLVAGGIGIIPIYSIGMALYGKGERFKLLHASNSQTTWRLLMNCGTCRGRNLNASPPIRGKDLIWRL